MINEEIYQMNENYIKVLSEFTKIAQDDSYFREIITASDGNTLEVIRLHRN